MRESSKEKETERKAGRQGGRQRNGRKEEKSTTCKESDRTIFTSCRSFDKHKYATAILNCCNVFSRNSTWLVQCCYFMRAASHANNKPQHITQSTFDLLACASRTLIMKCGERQKRGGRERRERLRNVNAMRAHITIYGEVYFMLARLLALCLVRSFRFSSFVGFSPTFSHSLFIQRPESEVNELNKIKPKSIMYVQAKKLALFLSHVQLFLDTKRLLRERSNLLS